MRKPACFCRVGGAEAEVTPLIVPLNIPERPQNKIGIVGWKTVNKKGDRTTVFSFIRISIFVLILFGPQEIGIAVKNICSTVTNMSEKRIRERKSHHAFSSLEILKTK